MGWRQDIAVVVMVTLLGCVTSHPQCLDFRPPFAADGQVHFCPHYSEFGCCTYVEDSTLMNVYMGISRELISRNLWHCSAYIHDLLCQPCSPYAAHIYDAEGTGQSRTFPGLCEDHCRRLFRECQEALYVLIYYINGSPQLVRSLSSENDFCGMVNLTDTDYCFPHLLTNPVLNGNIEMTAVNSEGCLCVEDFAGGLRNPVFMRYPDDLSGRLFVGEQDGIIYIHYADKTWLPQPFLNMSSVITVGRHLGDERGLLGIAFHPNYQHNYRFFLYYFTNDGGTPKIRISEFTQSVYDRNLADVQSERFLFEIDQPYENHNGGEILFGDDGYLYVFVGDGGAAGDPENNAQNMSALLGKVLRIDVDSPVLPYGIPPDNPFLDNPEARPEIYAYGVRNMWRCGKDRGDPATGHGRGRVICGDVGQSAFEELDLLRKGANYGWRGREGFACYDEDMCGNMGAEEAPIFVYPHRVGKSVTGGHFYRGCDSPNLNGLYIYGDYTNGKLFGLSENRYSGEWENRRIDMCGPEYCNGGLHNQPSRWILSFAEDHTGEVYMLTSRSGRSGVPDGSVYKLVDPRRRNNPLTCHERRRAQFTSSTSHLITEKPILIPKVTVKGPLKMEPTPKGANGCQNLRSLSEGLLMFTWVFMALM